MKNIIIGLGAKAQIGKDYVVSQLKKQYDYDIERIAFADKLKEDIGYLFDKNQLNLGLLLSTPENKKLVRPLLVEYGQIMRAFNPDVWVDRAFQGRAFSHEITAITDVRYPNEVARLKKLGGVYIHIDADVEPANSTEARYEPLMREEADFIITNDFSQGFVDRMASLITNLRQP